MVDIGGGTTDFTLIAVTEAGRRTVARTASRWASTSCSAAITSISRWPGVVAQRLAEKGTRIDSRQHQALWANCRVAKEKLLEPGSKAKEQPVTILGQRHGPGRRHDQGDAATRRHRAGAGRRLPAGGGAAARCRREQRRVGLQELGLPYAADPAITRHMARFLRQQAASVEHGSVRRGPSGLACPTHVLFNGGVLNAGLVRERILATLDAWLAEEGMPPVQAAERRGSDARGVARRGVLRPGAHAAAACAFAAACRAPITSAWRARCRRSPASPRRSRR